MLFTVIAFTILLFYGALEQGAVTVRDGMVVSGGIGLLVAGYLTFSRRSGFLAGSKTTNYLVAWIFAIAVVQLVPLPLSFLRITSPSRAEIASALDPRAWAPFTIVPAQSLIWTLRLASCLLVLLLARDLTRRLNWTWLLVIPVLVVAGAEAVLGVAQFFLSEPGTVARGTYVDRDHFSGLLELAIPIAVVMGIAVYRKGRKQFETPAATAIAACLLLGLAAVMFIAVIFSLSRMGFLSTLASLFFVGTVAACSLLSDKLDARLRWLPVGLVGLVIVLVFIYLPTDQLIDRFATLGNEDVTADTRAQIWHESIPLLASSAWVGSGISSYESAFLRFKHVAPMYSVGHAHNDYIQGLAELGILGFVPILLLTILAVRSAWRATSLSSDLAQHYLGIGCLGALAAILLHSIVDFNMYIPANALTVAWIGGIALGLYPPAERSS